MAILLPAAAAWRHTTEFIFRTTTRTQQQEMCVLSATMCVRVYVCVNYE